MAELIADLASLRDAIWLKIRGTAERCSDSTTLAQVSDYLEKGEQYSSYAATATDFAGGDPNLRASLQKASDSIGKVRGGLEKFSGGCHDIKAAAEISDAIAVLNAWSEGRKSPAEAAKAFDKLFGATARFAEKLPAPINQYALILKQISISNFFSTMQNLMDPEGDHPRGRALRDAMRE